MTGTSAKAGDDGQVGRGNRVTGLITPCQPMSLEAPAGKNPITHVGKIYSVLAQDMADKLVRELPEITKAQCLMVSRIGSPLSRPALLQIKIATQDGIPAGQLQKRIDEIAADRLHTFPAWSMISSRGKSRSFETTQEHLSRCDRTPSCPCCRSFAVHNATWGSKPICDIGHSI